MARASSASRYGYATLVKARWLPRRAPAAEGEFHAAVGPLEESEHDDDLPGRYERPFELENAFPARPPDDAHRGGPEPVAGHEPVADGPLVGHVVVELERAARAH